jgi:iron(III) transport system ATP-binding protein
MNNTILQIAHLSKRYDRNGPEALANLSLDVNKGEVLALVGESGSGKTTLLRLIAGFEQPDQGSIRLHGRILADSRTFIDPEKRNIGMVFQDYALFPNMRVDENLAYGLHRFPKKERAAMVAAAKELVGISELGNRYPHELSGGQQQRVALARALAPQPEVLLLDEPFSNLDELLKDHVRQEIKAILQKAETTSIFVTHDTRDALATAGRIAVLREGMLQQVGTPGEIYHNPVNRYVARFFGKVNFLEAYTHPDGLYTALGLLPIAHRNDSQLGKCTLICRPEHVTLCRPEASDYKAEVKVCTYYGDYWLLELSPLAAPQLPRLLVKYPHLTPPVPGEIIHFQFLTAHMHLLEYRKGC